MNAVEDKTCRICGFVDAANINIFDQRWKNMPLKILTVFPITLYESDPLPKNICEKCMYNVNVIFTESQKIFKVQKKWIDNVRTNKPKHSFVYALDLIEQTNRKMVEEIKNIVPDFIHRPARPVADLKEVQNSIEATETTNSTTPLPAPKNCISLMTNCNQVDSHPLLIEPEPISKTQFSMDYDPFEAENKPISVKTLKVPPASNTQQKIKEIRNKLQSNGCTLMSLNQAHPPPTIVSWTNPTPSLSSMLSIHCKYCLKTFPNIKFLAKHQLGHLVLSDRRIFDRKYLEKKVRRGRLIPVGDKKCIRCLNCWKLFVDNRAILDHWSKGDCDFFCNVCGQEFPTNPRMLREHVKGIHGISYKSSRRRVVESEKFMLRDLYNKTATPYDPHSSGNSLVQVKLEPGEIPNGPSKAKRKKQGLNSQGRVSCNICFCTFPNFQSKNSHMRKHKKREIPSATVSREITTEGSATNSLVEKNPEQRKLPPEIKVEPEEGYEILMEFSTDCQLKAEGPKFFTPILQNCSASSSLCPTPPSPAAGTSPSTSVPRLQVKKLSDLQDPCISSQNHDEDAPEFKFTPPKSTATSKTTANPSKSSTKTDDHMDYKRLYNCHPCGQKFSSKTELFQHKRQCQSNNKFSCRFCLRAFVTSADLQVHIMIMHKAI